MQQRKQRLTQNSHKLNWLDFNIDGIIGGKTSDGVRYLQLFLQDYSREFNNTTLNANCRKCLNDYLTKYKNKFTVMENKCDYILHEKRQCLRLCFGSSVFVSNRNITNEYAKELIKNYKKIKGDDFTMDFLFSKYPKEEVREKIIIDKLNIDVNPKESSGLKNEVKKKRTRKSKK